MLQRLSVLALLMISTRLLAVYEVGDPVKDLCWMNEKDKKVCLGDTKGAVQVLLYGAGWCTSCQEEMEELVPEVKKYEKKPVRFISLLTQGDKVNSLPDPAALKNWREKFEIPFPVVASPRDAGKVFFEPPIYIPNVVIIDQKGKLAFKEINPGVEALLEQVNKLLAN